MTCLFGTQNGSFPGNENEFCHHKLNSKPLHLNTLKTHLHIIQNIQMHLKNIMFKVLVPAHIGIDNLTAPHIDWSHDTQKPMAFDVS